MKETKGVMEGEHERWRVSEGGEVEGQGAGGRNERGERGQGKHTGGPSVGAARGNQECFPSSCHIQTRHGA
eukprot:1945591-Rhodomonas_salina.1